VRSLHFWKIIDQSSSSSSSTLLCSDFPLPDAPPPPSLAMCRAPAASAPPFLAPRVTPASASPLPRLALACSCLSTSHRRCPSCHDSCRLPAPVSAQPSLLLDPEHLLELPTHSFLPSRDYIPTTFSSPEHHPSSDLRHSLRPLSSAAHTTSVPRSRAPRAPSQLPAAHRPTQFPSSALEHCLPQRRQAQAPPPLDLTEASPHQGRLKSDALSVPGG
jgi:hypothetical protein